MVPRGEEWFLYPCVKRERNHPCSLCPPRPFYSQPRQFPWYGTLCWNLPTSPLLPFSLVQTHLQNELRQLITCSQSRTMQWCHRWLLVIPAGFKIFCSAVFWSWTSNVYWTLSSMVGGDTAADRVWGPRSAYITPCEICERLTIHCGEYSVECHVKYTATQKQQTLLLE